MLFMHRISPVKESIISISPKKYAFNNWTFSKTVEKRKSKREI